MTKSKLKRTRDRVGAVALLSGAVLAGQATSASAAPVVAAGYSLSVFATAPAGASAPDSIAIANGSVYVGYGNGGAADGSNGAISTIVRYSPQGQFQGSVNVVGHNDGLKFNASTGQLWAIQNEDANPNLVLINPSNLAASAALPFASTPHGGGYDDVAFRNGAAFVSASNPANNPNTAPAIVSAAVGASSVAVTPVLAGNATATNLVTGATTTLNLQDPDSLRFAPDGRLVLDGQSDRQLAFVSNPGTAAQTVGVLNLAAQVDDTAFAGTGLQSLLISDTGSGLVYALSGNFAPGSAFSAGNTTNAIYMLNLATGALDPIVTGLNAPHGEDFLSVPEPASLALLLGGLVPLVSGKFATVGVRAVARTTARRWA